MLSLERNGHAPAASEPQADFLDSLCKMLAGLGSLPADFQLSATVAGVRITIGRQKTSPRAAKKPSGPCHDSEPVHNILALLKAEKRPLPIRVVANKLKLSLGYTRSVMYGMYSAGVVGRDDDNRYFPKNPEPMAG